MPAWAYIPKPRTAAPDCEQLSGSPTVDAAPVHKLIQEIIYQYFFKNELHSIQLKGSIL